MGLNIRYEGTSVWNEYISPENNYGNEEFVKKMNEKIAELKEWADKNVDTNEDFDDELLEKQFELEEMINEEDFEVNCEWSCYSPEGTILVNDEELEMDEEEKKEFYEEEEQKIDLNEDWFIYRSYETELALEYESEGNFDKSKLKWVKDGEGGLEYEDGTDEYFEDVSGGESNGDEYRIWKIKVKGIEYMGEW